MFGGKAIIIIGARQVGKSTLFKMILEKRTEPILQLNCDEPEVKEMLSQVNSQELKLLIGKHKIVMIDEAQRVENIGLTLKLITDNFPEVQLLVTGSSSFELQNKLNEPLTGRKFEYHLYLRHNLHAVGAELLGIDNLGLGNGELQAIDLIFQMSLCLFSGIILRILT